MRAIPALSILLLLTACGGGGSDPAPGPSQPTGPRIETSVVFSGTTPFVSAQAAAWSPDGTKAAFAEATQADVYVVSTAGGTPVKATNYSADPEQGGESPAFLGDGRLVYYRGWMGDDHDMHLMVAPATQAGNQPAATVLRRFNGSDVGMTAGYASTPDPITLSSDGTMAVYGEWLLDWSTGSLVSTQVPGAQNLVLSPEGTHLAWVKADGTITIRALATQQETSLGAGNHLSWASGSRLGYATSSAYKVYSLSTGLTRSYPASLHLDGPGVPVISRDASRILYRTFGGATTGLSVGRLVD